MNKILIADNEYAIRLLYEEELVYAGYEVVTVGDGRKILQVIEEQRPDLIVLDIKMGEINGLDILQDIRNTYYDLPVILCTAYSGFKYDPKAIAADYFVVKSSDLSELKLKIKMAIRTILPDWIDEMTFLAATKNQMDYVSQDWTGY